MPKFKAAQSSFIGGRLSPKAYGRTDLAQYGVGAKEIKNFIVTPQGGITKRAGTEFVLNASLPNGFARPDDDSPPELSQSQCKLIPFVSSQSDKYLVQIYSGQNIRILNVDSKRVFNIGAPEAPLVSSANHNVGGGTWTFTTSELADIGYAQVGDVLIMVHPTKQPHCLRRIAEEVFELVPFQYGFNTTTTELFRRIPYRFQNTDSAHTMASNVTTLNGTGTLTSSKSFFHSGHIGAYFKVNHSATPQTGVVKITGLQSDKVATIRVIKALSLTSSTSDWEESSWSDYRGWPRTVGFHNQRIVFGGNASEPDTLWFGEVGDYSQLMDRIELDSGAASAAITDPFDLTLNSDQLDEIQWLSTGKQLNVGTKTSEWIVSQSDTNEVISPTNFQLSLETTHGSERIRPIRVSNGVIFIARGGTSIREFRFNFNEDRYRADYIGALAEDLARVSVDDHASFVTPKVTEMQFQRAPENIVWFVDSNGGLFSVTRDPSLAVISWHRHIMGGLLDSEPPKVLSIASLPSETEEVDNIWVLVKRTINSQTVYHIERMLNPYEYTTITNSSSSILDKPVYSDAASYTKLSTAGTVFGGLTHLIGESVNVLKDGSYTSNKTVSSGSNLLTTPSSDVDFTNVKLYLDRIGIVSVNATTDIITVATGHNMREGQLVQYSQTGGSDISTTGTVLVSGNNYYIRNPTATTFQLSEQKSSEPIDISSSSLSGTHTLIPVYEACDGTGGITSDMDLKIYLAGITRYNSSQTTTPGYEFSINNASAVGGGFSYAFSINERDKGKRLRIRCVSGTSLSTFFSGISVYDVTNATMIPTEGYKIQDNSFPRVYDRNQNAIDSSEQVLQGDFEHSLHDYFTASSDSTEYRLIFHYGSGSAPATITIWDLEVTSSGFITLDNSATEVIAGLNYSSVMRSMDFEAGAAIGSSQGTKKRIDEITMRFYNTIGGKIGRSESLVEEVIFRSQTNSPVDPLQPYTGDITQEFKGNYDRFAEVVFVHDKPLPCTLLSYYIRGSTND